MLKPSSKIFYSKSTHIPRNFKKSITEAQKRQVNLKNDLYKEWKSTNDIVEYNRKKQL